MNEVIKELNHLNVRVTFPQNRNRVEYVCHLDLNESGNKLGRGVSDDGPIEALADAIEDTGLEKFAHLLHVLRSKKKKKKKGAK